jgi:hypothetical protein
MMEKNPAEYSAIYQHFSPSVAQFLNDFLPAKNLKETSAQKEIVVAKGPLASISISGHEKGTAMTIIESELGMHGHLVAVDLVIHLLFIFNSDSILCSIVM